MDISETSLQQLDGLKKALVWKCSQLIHLQIPVELDLGLLRQTDDTAAVVVIPKNQRVICSRAECGKTEYYSSIFYFTRKSCCDQLLTLKTKLGGLDFKNYKSSKIAGSFLLDALDFGDIWRRTVLRHFWKELENGLDLVASDGIRELPQPEQLLLEWSVADGAE